MKAYRQKKSGDASVIELQTVKRMVLFERSDRSTLWLPTVVKSAGPCS